ncbi:MAG: hypothetical protein M1826_001147 [Phylliscum demangeonii]|nr:MAG: hypothetical protein M1826_001147 [Phylliscum demangeonii]
MITNRLSVLRNWEIEGKAIRLIMDEAVFVRRHLNIQLAPGKMPEEETDRKWSSATVEGPISQLVVAALPSETVGCLLDIKHLLDRRSTILLVQQGAGVLELINEHVFPDPAIRPAYMLAFLSHGVYGRAAHFSIRLSGSTGITRVTTVPRDITGSIENDSPDSTMWMIDALKRAPGIHPYFSPYLQYLGLMYKKLAVQAVLEPLSTIFEFRYNELASNLPIVRLVRLLLAEISLVLRSLPELQAASHRDWQFDPGRLERNVWEVAEHIQTSVSPMLRETQDARKPQIYFLNGYFVQRGQELGIRCLTNYMVMQMVLAKYVGNRQRKQSDIPMQ